MIYADSAVGIQALCDEQIFKPHFVEASFPTRAEDGNFQGPLPSCERKLCPVPARLLSETFTTDCEGAAWSRQSGMRPSCCHVAAAKFQVMKG